MDELQGYAKPVADVSDYDSAMERLRGARDATQNALGMLEERLGPVLTPIPESPEREALPCFSTPRGSA